MRHTLMSSLSDFVGASCSRAVADTMREQSLELYFRSIPQIIVQVNGGVVEGRVWGYRGTRTRHRSAENDSCRRP